MVRFVETAASARTCAVGAAVHAGDSSSVHRDIAAAAAGYVAVEKRTDLVA